AALPLGYARPADSARAPRGDTFSPRAHSSSLSKRLGHRGIVCRERNYRLTSPLQQQWPDQPDSLFRGQAPSPSNSSTTRKSTSTTGVGNWANRRRAPREEGDAPCSSPPLTSRPVNNQSILTWPTSAITIRVGASGSCPFR